MSEGAHLLGLFSVALLALLSLHGWGTLCAERAGRAMESGALAVALGLGAVVCLLGLLNLLRLAYGISLDLLLLVGLALGVRTRLRGLWGPWPAAVPITLIMAFTALTQIPPRYFNWHDDYEKYFAHPVRMLATGTVFGSPLNALGSETLGGMAGLHAMAVNHAPIAYLNAVDAGLGLLLCLLLPVSALPSRSHWPMALAAPLLVFAIEPQYVNVGALYLAAALVMASVLLASDAAAEALPSPPLLGLLYAALVVLKSNYAVFPILHLPLLGTGFALGGRAADAFRWAARTAGFGLLLLAPWLLLHAPHYLRFAVPEGDGLPASEPFPGVLSAVQLHYANGARFRDYTWVLLAATVAAGAAVMPLRRSDPRRATGLGAGALATAFGSLVLLALGPAMSGYDTAVRYGAPLVIGGAPVVFALAYRRGAGLAPRMATVLLALLCAALFAEPLRTRMGRAWATRSILAFAPTAAKPLAVYVGYSQEVLHGSARARVAAAQAAVPPGEPLVAWVSAPFLLDYRRNVVFEAERSGISGPWAYVPSVRYLVVEYQGPAVRPPSVYETEARTNASARERHIARSCLAFLHFVHQFRAGADAVYDDGGIVVLRRRAAGST